METSSFEDSLSLIRQFTSRFQWHILLCLAQGVIHYFNPHYPDGNQRYESITPKPQYSIPPRQQGSEFAEERRGFRSYRVSINHYWYGFCCYLHYTMNNHWACDVE